MRLSINTEPAVLGFLLDGPQHGYELFKLVNAQLSTVWYVSLRRVYSLVKTFEARGWIESEIQTQDARPSLKVLRITPAGRQAFAEWLDRPARGLREFRVDFFLRLYFARAAGPRSVEKLVQQQLAACEREYRDLEILYPCARRSESDIDAFVIGFRKQQLMQIAEWLKRNRTELCAPLPSAVTARLRPLVDLDAPVEREYIPRDFMRKRA